MALSDSFGEMGAEAKKLPMWFWIAGGGLVAYLVYRNSQSGATATPVTPATTSGSGISSVGSPGSGATTAEQSPAPSTTGASGDATTPGSQSWINAQQAIDQWQAHTGQRWTGPAGSFPAGWGPTPQAPGAGSIHNGQFQYVVAPGGGGATLDTTQFAYARAFSR